MKHRVRGRKFGRKKGPRAAFIKSLLNNLILRERIVTTKARALELRSRIESLVSLAKRRSDLAGYRLLRSRGLSPSSAKHLHKTLAERYKYRHGGYTRIIKIGAHRVRDAAETVILEFVK